MAVASCCGFVGLCAVCVLRGSGVDDSADDLKEKVPTNNEVCFHGETLPTSNYAELVGTMLGWGNDVAGGKGPSMAQAADRVLRIFGDDLPAVDRTGGLRVRQILAPHSSLPPAPASQPAHAPPSARSSRSITLQGMLKHQLGNAADTGDIRLGETACRGWLSMPNAEDDWQRRWVVLTFTTQAPSGSSAELIASGTVALYEDEREREEQKISTDFTKDFHCRKICRAYQPNTQEMRMSNMFMVRPNDLATPRRLTPCSESHCAAKARWRVCQATHIGLDLAFPGGAARQSGPLPGTIDQRGQGVVDRAVLESNMAKVNSQPWLIQ